MTSRPGERERARDLLASAGRVLILTGAGISAESGVPTFRGASGLWRNFRPEELATPEAFVRDARLVWEWYGMRREAISRCEPNVAHLAIAEWQLRDTNVGLATQNVDGLHADAARTARRPHAASDADGSEPHGRLLELHGAIFRSMCASCGIRSDHREPIDASSLATLPRCSSCAGLLRPDVVWFGESLDPIILERAFRWAEEADVCLVVGTSAVVQPAASLATVTRDTGGAIIEVNPERTPLTSVATVSIRDTATSMVPAIVPTLPPSGRPPGSASKI